MKHIRTLHPEVKVINDAEGIIEYVASDETLDQYDEIILANGWRFDNFAKNAPFVDSHDYSCIEKQLGVVTDWRIEGGQLIERVKYAIDVPACVLAKFAFDMVSKGYLKAVSVGFMSEAESWRGDKEFAQLCTQIGLSTEAAAQCRRIFKQQQQLELSQCIIGANPNALAKAWREGAATEEQMASIGFKDADAIEFLELSAATEARGALDAAMRLEYRRVCQRLYLSAKGTAHGSRQTDSSPRSRAGGDGSKQRERDAEQWKKLVEEMKRLTK